MPGVHILYGDEENYLRRPMSPDDAVYFQPPVHAIRPARDRGGPQRTAAVYRRWTPNPSHAEWGHDMQFIDSQERRSAHPRGQPASRDNLRPPHRSHHADMRLVTSQQVMNHRTGSAGREGDDDEPSPESYNPNQGSGEGRRLLEASDERVRTCNAQIYELKKELQACEMKLQAAEESITLKNAELAAEKRRVYLLEQELKQSIYTASILATTYNKNAQKMIETMEQEREHRKEVSDGQSSSLAWTEPHIANTDIKSKARYSSTAAANRSSGSDQMLLLPNAVDEEENDNVVKPPRVGIQMLHENLNGEGDPQWLKRVKFRKQVLTFLRRTCENELALLNKRILSLAPVGLSAAVLPIPPKAAPRLNWKRQLSTPASISQVQDAKVQDDSGKVKRRKGRLYDDFIWALQQARGRRGLRTSEWWRDKTNVDQKAQTAALGAACFGMLGFAAAVYQNEIMYSGGHPDDSPVC